MLLSKRLIYINVKSPRSERWSADIGMIKRRDRGVLLQSLLKIVCRDGGRYYSRVNFAV